MKNKLPIESDYILKTLQYSNKKAKKTGPKSTEIEYSYGIFVGQIKNLLHELNLTDDQKDILKNKIAINQE